MNWKARALIFCALGLLGAWPGPALAGSGTVLKIEGHDVYIDLGAEDGVGEGTVLELLHVIRAKDPRTGKVLRDTFPVGRLRVIKAGAKVCLASGPDRVVARAVVGDEIAIDSKARQLVDAWTPRPRRTKEQAIAARARERRENEHAQAEAKVERAKRLRDVWLETAGRPLEERVELWEGELEGAGRWRAAIEEEIAGLRQLVSASTRASRLKREQEARRALARTPARRLERADSQLSIAEPLLARLPAEAEADSPLDLAFAATDPGAVERASLYYRAPGEKGYRKLPLERGGAYLRARIPRGELEPPALEYFVEARSAGADSSRYVLGDPEEPLRVTVHEPLASAEPKRRDRSQVKIVMDYVDFDGGLAQGFDQYMQWEADFTYRFFEPIHAMRIGFGAMDGVGGPKDVIDEDPLEECRDAAGEVQCSDVDFSYAYFEIEKRFGEIVSFMLRPQFGKGSEVRRLAEENDCDGADSDDCRFFTSLGLSGALRIGDEMATNLELGVGLTQEIGTMFEAAFQWDAIPTFPAILSVQVTDQPVPEDFGVRLIADVWWRSEGWVYPSLRVSYQARDVDHAGVSGGLAVNFAW